MALAKHYHADSVDYGIRGVVFFVLGGFVGALADHLRRTTATSRRFWDLSNDLLAVAGLDMRLERQPGLDAHAGLDAGGAALASLHRVRAPGRPRRDRGRDGQAGGRHPETDSIPVVVLSGDSPTPAEVRRLREAGAADYLTKPLDLDALRRALLAAP